MRNVLVDEQMGQYPELMPIEQFADYSQLQMYYYYRIMAGRLSGEVRVSYLQAALSTGVSMLMWARNHMGLRIYGYEPSKPDAATVADDMNQDADDDHKLINIAYHIRDVHKRSVLYPKMKASFPGSMKDGKRSISFDQFESEQQGGESTADLEMAMTRAWSMTCNELEKALLWVEAQFAVCGIIRDPKMLLSMMPIYGSGEDSVFQSLDMQMDMDEELDGAASGLAETTDEPDEVK